MSKYYDLLRKPVLELTDEEHLQLERASKIPPTVRIICESRFTALTAEIVKLEAERDEIRDFLDGYEYDSKKEVPF